jgi:hypothetical protein
MGRIPQGFYCPRQTLGMSLHFVEFAKGKRETYRLWASESVKLLNFRQVRLSALSLSWA